MPTPEPTPTVRQVDPVGSDADRVALVARRADPTSACGPADFRRNMAREPRHLLLLAGDGAADRAAVELGRIESWDEPDGMWMWFWSAEPLAPPVAAALWHTVTDHCAQHGVRGLRTAQSVDRPDALELLLGWGFREVERNQRVRLRLTSRPEPPACPPGLTVASLAERPDMLDGLVAIDAETIPDIPGEPGVEAAIPDRAWWDSHLASGVFDARTVVAVLDEQRPVAYTLLRHYAERGDVADVEYTATARAWRGRGLATLAKRAGHVAAWDVGVREIRSWNHLDNAPMRAVNTRLGFERGSDLLQLRAVLPK